MWNNSNLNIGYIYQKKSWGSSWSQSLLLTFIATKESCTYCSKYPHKNREAIFYRRSVESWVAKAETARFPDVEIIGRRWSGRKSDQTISRLIHSLTNIKMWRHKGGGNPTTGGVAVDFFFDIRLNLTIGGQTFYCSSDWFRAPASCLSRSLSLIRNIWLFDALCIWRGKKLFG